MATPKQIGTRIKLRDLEIIMSVARAGSMGKAAQQLNMSQPNISRSIADLERLVGVRLFDRHAHGIIPTEFGRALLDCGAAVFDDLHQGVRSLEFLADPRAGEVRIGCNPFIAASFVSTVVDRLSRQHPRITFHVVAAEAESLHHDLRERNIDLLIAWRFDPMDDERLSFDVLLGDKYAVVAGSNSPWVARRRIRLSDLMDEAWALPPAHTVIGSAATQAFRASGLPYPRLRVSTITPEVRMTLLSTGRFLTIFPTSILRFSAKRENIKVLPVTFPMSPVSLGVVTLKSRTLNPVARLFIERARDVAKLPNRH
jgi:DNA-binding transcriptional LysR family regulator